MASSRRCAAVPRYMIAQKAPSEITEDHRNFRSLPVPFCTPTSHHETADDYVNVIAQLNPRHRVIVCSDALQWILQRRKNGDAERPWRSIGYVRTRAALLRVSASVCGRIDPAALAILLALPDQIGRAA